MIRTEMIGNLAKDVEVIETKQGKIAKLRVLVDNHYGDKKPEGFNVTVFNQQIVKALANSKAGTQIFICGNLKNTRWEGQNGETRYGFEIQVWDQHEMKFLGSLKRDRKPKEEADDNIPY